jgi:hypothetical protein
MIFFERGLMADAIAEIPPSLLESRILMTASLLPSWILL